MLPAGTYCLKTSNEFGWRYWTLAIMPFMFGIQQLLEGALWLALPQGDMAATRGFALGFLLFSHFFGWGDLWSFGGRKIFRRLSFR